MSPCAAKFADAKRAGAAVLLRDIDGELAERLTAALCGGVVVPETAVTATRASGSPSTRASYSSLALRLTALAGVRACEKSVVPLSIAVLLYAPR